jgi:hypothetical protein
MLRALSLTDMSHGWLHAFVASWNGPYSLTWFAAWTALALFAIPALFNAFIFLMSAIYPRNGAPFCFVDELMVNFAYSRKEAKFIAVELILVSQSFAFGVVAWNLGEISHAVIDILTGHALYKDGFSLLAGAFFASACGYVMVRMFMKPGWGVGYSDEDDYGTLPYNPTTGLPMMGNLVDIGGHPLLYSDD